MRDILLETSLQVELSQPRGGDIMKYNYSKLLGKIKEQGFTQAKLADAIGINRGTLSAKLNGQYSFSVKEIDSICKELDISNNEIGAYFFTK